LPVVEESTGLPAIRQALFVMQFALFSAAMAQSLTNREIWS
jgi:hypothetical protein